ncbi:DUF4911 domain-containing protein [Thermodesulfatator autotrophicus]|uniref:DUF4911 domain-containing protein n=1 Tax=Thermodesulfatator autotrophicus TaxID=1795632 RepID=A0A177E9L1_9BACT|nr:DUF4911 domain-containing protein [Thermodesulfatator autotrophicus]OAG28191.1 hypothetical protein TH606_02780 [Thermodesulfatator autotrophicus]
MKSNEQKDSLSRKEETLLVEVPKDKVYFVKFVLEAAGHLTFMTIKPGGRLVLRFDAEERETLKNLLLNLPFDITIKE